MKRKKNITRWFISHQIDAACMLFSISFVWMRHLISSFELTQSLKKYSHCFISIIWKAKLNALNALRRKIENAWLHEMAANNTHDLELKRLVSFGCMAKKNGDSISMAFGHAGSTLKSELKCDQTVCKMFIGPCFDRVHILCHTHFTLISGNLLEYFAITRDIT